MSQSRTRLKVSSIAFLVTLLGSSCALPAAQVPGQDSNAQASGSVTGRVVDGTTGNGIAGARVSLYPRASGARNARPANTTTIDDGSFRFEQVEPGSYVFFCMAADYAPAPNLRQIVTVAAGQQVSDLAVQLAPLGALQGKVLDDAGKGIAGITVELFSSISNEQGAPQLRRLRATTSGAGGVYQFVKISPGRYYLAAGGQAVRSRWHSAASNAATGKPVSPTLRTSEGVELNYVRTFYPHATSLESASPLEIPPGGSAPNADVQLQRAETFHVSGKVEMPASERLRPGAMLSLAPRDTPAFGGTGWVETVRPNQTFLVDKVPSGSYTLWLLGTYDLSTGGSRRRILARQDVDVNAGNIENIRLSPFLPVTLTGHVTLSGSSASTFAQMRINLTPTQGRGLGRYLSLPVSSDGSFEADNVDPGQYLVRPVNLPPGSYVKSIAWNQQDITTGGIDLSQGSGGELQISLRNGAGQVDGSATATGSAGGISGFAALVPEDIPPDGSGTLLGQLKPDGTFSISNVPPGRYYAYATEHWTSIWRNVSFLTMMQRNGKSVIVTENGHAQLQLPLLTVDELQADAAALGLSLQ